MLFLWKWPIAILNWDACAPPAPKPVLHCYLPSIVLTYIEFNKETSYRNWMLLHFTSTLHDCTERTDQIQSRVKTDGRNETASNHSLHRMLRRNFSPFFSSRYMQNICWIPSGHFCVGWLSNLIQKPNQNRFVFPQTQSKLLSSGVTYNSYDPAANWTFRPLSFTKFPLITGWRGISMSPLRAFFRNPLDHLSSAESLSTTLVNMSSANECVWQRKSRINSDSKWFDIENFLINWRLSRHLLCVRLYVSQTNRVGALD
jgi:hypothetical protein